MALGAGGPAAALGAAGETLPGCLRPHPLRRLPCLPPPPSLQALATKTLPLEVVASAKHDRRGVLSMARHSDPNSGGSSFSVLLGPAPHLDMQYSVFGEVTKGLETLARFEQLETVREGIFVMPKERITILSTYS